MDPAKWQRSPVYLTVRSIFAGQDMPYKRKYDAIIHTTNQDYPAFKVTSVDFVRDYHSKMMDDIQIRVEVPMGDYAYMLYPQKDNLEVTLTKTALKGIGDTLDGSAQIEQVRYKAIWDPVNPTFTSKDLGNYSQKAMNTAQFIQLRLRLMDRNVEPLRVLTTQGVFRGVTPKQIITALLLGESQGIIVDGQPAVSGLDMVDPDNLALISQLVVPSGTYICEIPTLVQEGIVGVYKFGIGTYFQRFNGKPTWFVYPLYDFDRFDSGKEKNTAIFYSAPANLTSGVERTYRIQGNILQAVINSEKTQKNTTDVTQLNHGVGYRYADQGAFMLKPVIIDSKGQAFGARGNLNQEMGFMQRADGLNYAPVIKNNNTNSYNEMSKVSARQATITNYIWENGDASLIYPGMPSKFVFMQDDDVAELKGTIQGVHESYNRMGTLGQPDRFSTRCMLAVATELNQQLPESDPESSFVPTST